MNNNNRKRPRIDPIRRLEHQLTLAHNNNAVLRAENIAYDHASDTLAPRVIRIHRQLQSQLQHGIWDEV